jgi:uncharacterized protein (DUF1697 family)
MTSRGTHVALLRGVNVGGKNVLPMKALAAMFVEAGCADVRTFIQSGNVVFAASPTVARKAPTFVAAAIERDFGFSAPIQTRSVAELRAVVDGNPLYTEGCDPALHAVVFLAEAPTAKQVATLDPDRSPGDSFAVRGREIYLACPNGFARTKLSNAWFDGRLGTVSTLRNWRTTAKLLEIAER